MHASAVPGSTRSNIALLALCCAGLLLAGCQRASAPRTAPSASRPPAGRSSTGQPSGQASGAATRASSQPPAEPAGQFTISFAGDVHFAERTATLLAQNPVTAFGVSKPVLSKADLTMVNLETAIAVGGQPETKSFTFEAPPSAFTALADAGIDVATMANNHGADYGSGGLGQTLAAIKASRFPVVGIGSDADQAFAPYYTTLNGVRIAIVAASQVQDETLVHFSATDTAPGIASAFSDRLINEVRTAKARAEVVIAYIHWGTEYQTCPNADQQALASTLAAAGVSAIIGTHAHVLEGAGWRADGSYVAYGLGNYYWWRSFGNDQDDNGVLTLTFDRERVVAAKFLPSQLDDQGISPPATGVNRQRILAEFDDARSQCTNLSATAPK
jgi:hypothetical protein